MLESVLVFYDKFAELNDTNSRLQGEAARAYRKVAAIYRWMGRDKEAEEAYGRSLRRFVVLAGQHPSNPEYQYELARTIALDDQPGVDRAAPERSESALRKGIAIVEGLAEESPGKNVYAAALARWNARLASVLEQLGRPEDAEARYRASITHDEWLSGRMRDPSIVHWVLASNRDALARLLIRHGRPDDARPVLDRAESDLLAVADDGRPLRQMGSLLAGRLESLSKSFHELGDERRAAELSERANQVCPEERRDYRGLSPRRIRASPRRSSSSRRFALRITGSASSLIRPISRRERASRGAWTHGGDGPIRGLERGRGRRSRPGRPCHAQRRSLWHGLPARGLTPMSGEAESRTAPGRILADRQIENRTFDPCSMRASHSTWSRGIHGSERLCPSLFRVPARTEPRPSE